MNRELIYKYLANIKDFWRKGFLQKSFRVTYDVIWNIILFFIIIGVVGLFFAGGVGAGYFASLVKDEVVRPKEDMEKQIYNYEETSELYFANNVYLGDFQTDLYREEISLDQVSEHLKKAIIYTEDSYFETHNGVVPKAIMRALFQEATNSSVKSGGSTLTQQLIKNQILTNEVSFERKAKEILLALRLEQFFDKDEILEAYLNISPFGRNASGRNIAGVQTAAQGIFGVDAKDLNIPQAAFIAGLPQSPSYYTPFTNSGELKSEDGLHPGLSRMQTVLSRMHENGYINDTEYEQYLNYDIVADFAEPTPSPLDKYPYVTNEAESRAEEIIAVYLAEQAGYTEADLASNEELKGEYQIRAERSLEQDGYKIHTTIDKEIYDTFQEVAKNFKEYGPDRPEEIVNEETGEKTTIMEPVQTASILIENNTGKIVSFVGGRDFNLTEVNHATDALRHNGSTMKPILVYGPAMEAGVAQPGSIIADIEGTVATGVNGSPWSPNNYSRIYHGLVSAREALNHSYNVPAAKVYMDIINNDPAAQYLEKMGFTSLEPIDHDIPSLALGTPTYGVTVEENTNAYSTFGNNGQFVDAYMIEKIETIDGKIIYQHESEAVEVFTPQTNYLTVDMMRTVLTQGNGTRAINQLQNRNVDWAGKTGTTSSYYDAWFMGVNPNVSLGVWLGYDHNKRLPNSVSSTRATLWAQFVNAATEVNPELMAPTERFERPGGLVERSYCVTSGMLPSSLCTELGLVDSDIFNAKYVPTKRDNSLIKGTYVIVNGKAFIAGENTPNEFIQEDGIAFNPEWLKENGYDTLNDITDLIPRGGSSIWNDIKIPSTDEVANDGQNPNTPGSFVNRNGTLTWDVSSSTDVVGYRIYRANNPTAPFELIGSTMETAYRVNNNKALYLIRAVDYFGQESAPSKKITIGDFTEEKEKEKPTKPDQPEPPAQKPDEDE
ncbi:transglycosylase domain-containing protein [Radiobacillus sp. PE A8.2]|uniref:transglycosylase domain-containing protein n=1 Tax=Radiobacillus sp. PE A8.2 TaxID=3380349 RepID=UPI00389068F4